MRQAFTGATAILPDRLLHNSLIICQAGRIECVESLAGHEHLLETCDDVVCIDDKHLAPGYVDIHVHGGAGADFMDGSVEATGTVCQAHLNHGTTTIFPTTTTGSMQQILAMIDSCRQASREFHIPGIHLYGPYFAEDKVGCHSLSGRRPPIADEFRQYFETGFVRIATCAAELDGADLFYQMAKQNDCLITCGHSNASWTEMQSAFDNGMRHVDHFWCAMSSVPSLRQRFSVPMQASMAEFVLMQTDMSTEVIADGCHLAPELLEFAFRMIGPDRLCLVTDCNRALDLPPGEYRFGNQSDGSMFKSDGKVGWAMDEKSLASSIVGMDHMVRHMHQTTSAPLFDVIRMATMTPARLTGIDDQVGSIKAGKRADLLVLDQNLTIETVLLAGEAVYSAESPK